MRMRPSHSLLVLGGFLLAVFAGACARGENGAEAPASAEEQVPVVADSIIESQVQASLDADPRLDAEGIRIEAHSTDQEVTLVGTVPTRREMSFAREIANSVLGVKRVHLDSLVVESEQRGAAGTQQTVPAPGEGREGP